MLLLLGLTQVLAILLTAPLGAILIQSFGPRLLTKEPEDQLECDTIYDII